VRKINLISEIVNSIPEFLLYIVPGFLFIFTYKHLLYKDEKIASETTYLVLNSIIASFVIKTLYETAIYKIFNLYWSNTSYRYLITIFLFSVVFGYITSKAVSSSYFDKFRSCFGIDRTSHSNIWNDAIKRNTWVRIWLKDSTSYYGQVKYIEDYSREPLVVLESFQFLNSDEKVVIDNTSNSKYTVLLNLSQFEHVEIADN